MEGPQVELSDIQRFYKNSTVFLTGTTGFIGKLFLEKVLRALPVKKVFILIREKKNVPALKRSQELFEAPIFDQSKRSNPEVFDKVVVMEGDCALPWLGLSEKDIETFIREVDVIFHCAASVRFNENIKRATRTNVRGTKDLIELAKRTTKALKTFVYVGTAFSNSNKREIKEEIYPSKISAENLIPICESLDEECLASITKPLIRDWPNTYTFTKHVTEDYINREGKDIPICVARPTVVTSTFMEPLRAYVDNFFTLAGFVITTALGICRITYCRDTTLDIIPADYVVNECIAAGWYTGETFKRHRTEIPVYNISSYVDNPITQDNVYGLCDYYCRLVPTPRLMTYPIYFRTTCKYNYLLLRFLFHTVVAYIMDFVLKIQGKEQMYVEGIQRLHQFQEAYEHFTANNFHIHVENAHTLLKKMSFQDKELFEFDMRTLNWDTYFSQYARGLRFYLLKEPMDNLPEGIERYQYLKKVMIVILVFLGIVIYVLGKIFLCRVMPFVFGIVAYFLRGFVC